MSKRSNDKEKCGRGYDMPNIIKTDKTTLQEWAKLSYMLFRDHHTFEDMFENCKKLLQNKRETGFLYEIDDNFVGFINISIRNDYVNGTNSSPVAFVEAIYVIEECRGKGIARELLKVAEIFARENGCTQLASDCLITNTVSEKFHKSCGFEETERVIYFVKNV